MTSTYHETAGRGLATTWELDLGYLTFARFAELLVERGLPHAGSSSWPTEKMTLEGLFDHALSTQRDSERAMLALEAEEPESWDCPRCGLPACRDEKAPPAPPRNEPYKTHLAYVKERRSDADGEAILAEALAKLRAQREGEF